MPKRLADHLDRDTTVLGSGSPRMAQRVGSDGEVETQPLCQGFQAVVENNFYFVDKSMFIKELLDNRSEVSLFMRPRRFGKTLSLSMLKYYFEKAFNENGAELDKDRKSVV